MSLLYFSTKGFFCRRTAKVKSQKSKSKYWKAKVEEPEEDTIVALIDSFPFSLAIGSAERAKKKLSQYGGPIFLLSKSPTVTSSSPTIYLAESAQKLNRTN